MSVPKSPYLTVAETAAYLRCSERKIWQLLRANELERCRLIGARTVIPLASIRALENRAFASESRASGDRE